MKLTITNFGSPRDCGIKTATLRLPNRFSKSLVIDVESDVTTLLDPRFRLDFGGLTKKQLLGLSSYIAQLAVNYTGDAKAEAEEKAADDAAAAEAAKEAADDAIADAEEAAEQALLDGLPNQPLADVVKLYKDRQLLELANPSRYSNDTHNLSTIFDTIADMVRAIRDQRGVISLPLCREIEALRLGGPGSWVSFRIDTQTGNQFRLKQGATEEELV